MVFAGADPVFFSENGNLCLCGDLRAGANPVKGSGVRRIWKLE